MPDHLDLAQKGGRRWPSFSSVVRVQIMSLPASLEMTGPGWVTDLSSRWTLRHTTETLDQVLN